MSDTNEKVRTAVAEIMGLAPTAIVGAHRFDEDLGADELDLVELAMELEEQFGIEINDGEFHALKTIDDVVRFIDTEVG